VSKRNVGKSLMFIYINILSYYKLFLYFNYTWTQIKVKKQFVVRKDMDVNEHERLSNITLGHKLK
jgi:uncharacterized membrane protein